MQSPDVVIVGAMGGFALVDGMYRDRFTCSLSGIVMAETAEVLPRQR